MLNAGEGFNDIFEEEISMGEYAGEPKMTEAASEKTAGRNCNRMEEEKHLVVLIKLKLFE